MTQAQAVEIIRQTYPKAVIRKVWMPKRGTYFYKIISEPLAWQDGIGGQFTHVELSAPRPKPLDALVEAAVALAKAAR